MIRTFHAKIDPVLLIGCLLPSTILAIFFFWVMLPIPALFFWVLMVFVVERMIHTSYVLTDDGKLWISKGRFVRKRSVCLEDISKVELFSLRSFFLVRRRDAVMLTLQDGTTLVVTPFPAEEFCHVLLKRKHLK